MSSQIKKYIELILLNQDCPFLQREFFNTPIYLYSILHMLGKSVLPNGHAIAVDLEAAPVISGQHYIIEPGRGPFQKIGGYITYPHFFVTLMLKGRQRLNIPVKTSIDEMLPSQPIVGKPRQIVEGKEII